MPYNKNGEWENYIDQAYIENSLSEREAEKNKILDDLGIARETYWRDKAGITEPTNITPTLPEGIRGNKQISSESTSGLGIKPPPEPLPRQPELTAWQPTNTWKGDVTDSSGNMVGGYVPVSPDAITISGVGNKMMIDDPNIPNMPPVDEYGNPVAPETVRRIQSNLGDAPISEEDRKFFGMKPPSETELDVSDELDKFSKLLDKEGVTGDKRIQFMLQAKRDLQNQRANLVGARAEAYGKIRMVTVYDNKTGQVISTNMNDFNKMKEQDPTRYVDAKASPDQKERLAQAAMRGGATTSNVSAAVKMYKMEAPELIDLRQKVMEKGLLPESGFKDIGALNQWLGAKTNDPDVALLQKKTKFLADSLMRVIGGSQGGEWAFKVASDILDPSYSPEAFAGIVNSHGLAMERIEQARRGFGKENNTPSTTKTPPINVLTKGKVTIFANGQKWTLDNNGQPIQVK